MTKKSKPAYGNESISALKGADRVRKRPGVIFGSDGIEGCEHAIFEILSNSIDEAREGYGNKIHITHFLDNSIEIQDFGRGIPLDFNEGEGRFNWELIYCELYAGGKYDNDEGESYEYSLGLNGLGACATQYSSEFMDVVSRRDGVQYSLHFKKGENVTEGADKLLREPYNGKITGTTQRFRLDIDVFTDTRVSREFFEEILKKQAVVNAGLKFVFRAETAPGQFDETEFVYENGITDYVIELAGDSALTSVQFNKTEKRGRDRSDKPEYKVKVEAAFCFSNQESTQQFYHNSSWLEHGGAPDKAARSAFVSALDSYAKQTSKYQKNESKISFTDIADSLILVTNGFSTFTSYENQTKKAINNKFVQEMMTEFLRTTLEIYFIENRQDADRICEQILINKRSREQAEKTRLNIKKKLAGTIDVTNRVQKFVDCRSKDLDLRELYIVEGDSALGSCKQGRDAMFQAIMPIRGKILNCLKADYDKVLKSDIITDLIKVLGCGIDVKTHNKELSSFEISMLRWNKVIICTDGDVDGFQIRTLVLTMLYRLTPALITKGFVYIAETPLYEITSKGAKPQTFFAYTDKERDEIIKKLDGKCGIQRSKGLGENEPEMMWQTTMNPQTRRLIRVVPEEAQMTSDCFDLFLGDNLQGRKDFIAEHGSEYIDLTDVS